MEAYDLLSNFLCDLFTFLVGVTPNIDDLKIFRKHNNKLDTAGDLSFPLNINGWSKYLTSENDAHIIEYIEKFDNNTLTELDFFYLFNESKTWNSFHVDSVKLVKNKVCVFLNRSATFKKVIKTILNEKEKYGTCNLNIKSVRIKTDIDNENLTDLTNLRIDLIKKVTTNILKYCECNVDDNSDESDLIYLTNKSKMKSEDKKVVCGVVITNKYGKKNTNISSEDFFRKRTVDMQLMAQHKYGVRVTSEPGWDDFFKRLGNAAVIIDLLNVKPNRPLIINEDCTSATCSKGASFILYNCARLSEIFKRFDSNVSKEEYAPLPDIESIDFNLLNQSEEWELLYVYLMQYPCVVRSCVSEILECKLHTHFMIVFLESLCSTFSVYYRRVRVLTEGRMHLIPVMHTRICLLKVIQQVLHNALLLLDIQPIKQM